MTNRKPMFIVVLSAALLLFGAGLQAQPREQAQAPDQDIYGYQLMTSQERDEYRARMRAAKTFEEREQIRREHHEQMAARAKERGLTLPSEPPARGMGPGMAPGAGGMGPGGGQGPGRGPRY